MNIYWEINEGIYIFTTKENKIKIHNYIKGIITEFNYVESIIKILDFLRQPHTTEEIHLKFNMYEKENLNDILYQLYSLEILIQHPIDTPTPTSLNILLIGVGTLGSHIYRDLSNLKINHMVLVDNDIVDASNINRQVFNKKDINKYKVDVLAENIGKISKVTSIKETINNFTTLENIIKRHDINLIIQCADKPSVKEISLMIEKAANAYAIPYIIPIGYVSKTINLPEFYYPNQEYCYSYKRPQSEDNLLFYKASEKALSHIVEHSSSLITQQILNYMNKQTPIKFGERGFFDINEFKWSTEKII